MHISISHNYCAVLSGEESSKLTFAFVAHPVCNVSVFKSNQFAVEFYRRSVNYFCFN